jgi:hypothetical protein
MNFHITSTQVSLMLQCSVTRCSPPTHTPCITPQSKDLVVRCFLHYSICPWYIAALSISFLTVSSPKHITLMSSQCPLSPSVSRRGATQSVLPCHQAPGPSSLEPLWGDKGRGPLIGGGQKQWIYVPMWIRHAPLDTHSFRPQSATVT